MADIQSRPSASTRGRGSARGGRGGLSSRGGRAAQTSPNANGDPAFSQDDPSIALLIAKYGPEIDQLSAMLEGWTNADIAYALDESNGNVNDAAEAILNGTITKWSEVSSNKKHHGRVKPKEPSPHSEVPVSKTARASRAEPGRGGRGRGTERGGARGGRARGASHVATNGSRHKDNQALSIPTEKAWAGAAAAADGVGTTDDPPKKEGTTTIMKPAAASAAAAAATPPAPPKPAVKTWASMLRQSTETKPVPKPTETPSTKPAEPIEPLPPAPTAEPEPSETQDTEPEPAAEVEPEPEPEEAKNDEKEEVVEPPATVPTVIEPEVALPPSKDQLTEVNLEQVADTSKPPATATAASTAADSWDPRQNPPSTTATPVSASQQQHQATAKAAATAPVGSGFMATAQKAAERLIRGPSHHQRRILDQEEAVRMPGHREVDRTTVQFGAFSLGDAEEDIDDEREEPETRAQPPADSPVAHPRASLPPAQPTPVPDAFPASKPTAPAAAAAPPSIPTGPSAGSTPIASVPQTAPTGPSTAPSAPAGAPTQPAAAAAATAPAPQQPPQGPQQYGRFPQAGAPDQPGFPQKPYDSFGGPGSNTSIPQSQPQYESGLPAQVSQAQQGPIQQPTSGTFSSAPGDYPYYTTADQNTRGGPYNAYYNQQYGAQQQQASQAQAQAQAQAQSQQEGGIPSQQRGFSGYNNLQSDTLSQYPQSATQASRFGAAAASEAHNSGHNTPNPTQNQPTPGQGAQSQSHVQQQPHGQFGGYNHPYNYSPYYSNYMYGQNNYGGNYGGGPYGKGALYGQHQYGMSPQGAPFDHSSSGNAGFGQGSLHRADSGLGSGLGEYQRGGSAQAGSQPGLGGGSGFGMHDAFGRGAGYPGQAAQAGFNAQGSQPGNAGSDDLKPHYGDPKTTGGPSPSLAAAARPGSAANTAAAQSGLPPPQSTQQGMGGYGGYPSHGQGQHGLHGNQGGTSGAGYGMGGGIGQGHSNAFPYGNQYGGQSFYGNQQRGGWGGNYH